MRGSAIPAGTDRQMNANPSSGMTAVRVRQVSKHRNVRTEYNGCMYQSAKEAKYAAELDLRMKAHDIRSWGRQVPVPMRVNGKRVCKYVIDFVIYHNDGAVEYVEVKGREEPLWKLKWALFEALYPDLRKTVIR
jgi:Protein of unknown function (DUF1064)